MAATVLVPHVLALVTAMSTWDKIKYQAKYIMYLTLILGFRENVHQIKLGLVYRYQWSMHHVAMRSHECLISGTHGAYYNGGPRGMDRPRYCCGYVQKFPPLGTKPMKTFPGKFQPCPGFVLQIEYFPALYRFLAHSRWPLDCNSFIVRDGTSECC